MIEEDCGSQGLASLLTFRPDGTVNTRNNTSGFRPGPFPPEVWASWPQDKLFNPCEL